MTFPHEAIAACPVLSAADKALIRAMATRRFAYCLAASESATNFIAVDPDAGTIPLYLIQNNVLFAYDSTDSTTANDGVTCLVTSDGKRYKSGTLTYPWSVLTKGTTAEPGSPSVGDRYLVPTAATGTHWSGKDGQVAIYTAAGWFFSTVPIGRFLYVQDETAFYHRNASGVWTAGVGSIALGAGSVNITNVLGAKASYIIKIENQTTNAPPASPVAPVAYIIGSVPTGAWAGNPGKLAVCLVNGAFTIISPDIGDQVYDKTLGVYAKWNGTSWDSSSGAWVNENYVSLIDSSSVTDNNLGSYYGTFSGAAPLTSQRYFEDSGCLITWIPKRSGAKLQFYYEAVAASIGAQFSGAIALFYDSVTTAIAWRFLRIPDPATNSNFNVSITFRVTAPDAFSHNYYVRFMAATSANRVFQVNDRYLQIQERA